MILKIEELSMNAWPSLQTNLYDGWVLRFSNGYTKRANSINPIYPSTINVDTKIKMCENFYSNKRLPIVYKITRESCPSDIDSTLESKGYKKQDETSVRILSFNDLKKVSNVKGIKLESDFTEEWIESFILCSNIIEKLTIDTMRKMLANITGEKICTNVIVNNEIVACGFGVIENNFLGIFDIIVKHDKRGLGYGKDIMQAILREAQKRNVESAYLQVVVGNEIAENLYSKLGFKEVYRYWYRVKTI